MSAVVCTERTDRWTQTTTELPAKHERLISRGRGWRSTSGSATSDFVDDCTRDPYRHDHRMLRYGAGESGIDFADGDDNGHESEPRGDHLHTRIDRDGDAATRSIATTPPGGRGYRRLDTE